MKLGRKDVPSQKDWPTRDDLGEIMATLGINTWASICNVLASEFNPDMQTAAGGLFEIDVDEKFGPVKGKWTIAVTRGGIQDGR